MAIIDATATSPLSHFLIAKGLAAQGEEATFTPLTGGVSSDIWRVDLPGRSLCVKRALTRLKVAAVWLAPVSRNAYEWAWIMYAAAKVPGHVPRPLAHDPQSGMFAMAYLPADDHPVWKQQLLAGRVEPGTAAAVGDVIGTLHAASAGDRELAREFDTLENFHALRLEPYLLSTAERHPDVSRQLLHLAERTGAAKLALVHGDVSPKNILVGPEGPVILDAECAWYGDPAFDLAFCLNHLLLKCVVRPERTPEFLRAFEALTTSYLRRVNWEPHSAIERRTAELLPGLLLGRVDGKSPVEYITCDEDRMLVRRVALRLLQAPASRLAEVAQAWGHVVGSRA